MKNKLKKYVCSECFCIVEIKILKTEKDSQHKIAQFCPLCSDYLEPSTSDSEELPFLKNFDDYDQFNDEDYYDEIEDDDEDVDDY